MIHKDVTMIPGKCDNYGLDSCAILALPTTPTTLVIAESTGKLHHCVMLESPADEEESAPVLHASATASFCTMPAVAWTLHVLETVELELGLSVERSPEERSYVCPVSLARDPNHEQRYFAYHNAGLHAVTVKFAAALNDFAGGEDDADESTAAIVLPAFDENSHVEYLVCTRAFQADKTNPVIGLTFLQSPPGIVLYLNSGQVVSLELIRDAGILDQYLGPPTTTNGKAAAATSLTSPAKHVLNGSVNQSIEKQVAAILNENAGQPLLHLDKSANPTPMETLQLLQQAVATIQERYFTRFKRAQHELEGRVKSLQVLKRQQEKEIAELQRERDVIRETAENLAVRYEDIVEKQETLTRRAQEVVRLASLHLPANTNGEKEFTRRTFEIRDESKEMHRQLEQIRCRMEQFRLQTATRDGKERAKADTFVLPPKREQILMELLSDATKQIEMQIKDVRRLLEVVNVSN